MYPYGPLHMAGQKQNDQLENTFSSYVRIRDVALKTCQRRWTIGRSVESGSGISLLAARHDDDDDLSKLLRWSLIIIVTRTIDLIFSVIITTFRPICPSALFRCFMPRTELLIWSTGIDCSNSVNHDQVQVLSYCNYSWLILPSTCRWFRSEPSSHQMPNLLVMCT